MPVGTHAPVAKEPSISNFLQKVTVPPPVIGSAFGDRQEVTRGGRLVQAVDVDRDAGHVVPDVWTLQGRRQAALRASEKLLNRSAPAQRLTPIDFEYPVRREQFDQFFRFAIVLLSLLSFVGPG